MSRRTGVKVGILGAGRYGKALGGVLRKRGHLCYYFDPFVFPDRNLKDVTDFSDVLILATPTGAVREIISQFPDRAFAKPLIVTTKGMLDKALYDKFRKYEILAGPAFAEDILAGKRVKLTVAGYGVLSELTVSENLFKSPTFLMDKTEDVFGVMMLGALKNIYAIESGRRGLNPKSEEFKEYILAVLKEAQKFLIYNGGFLETVRFSAGVGDFVLTSGSEKSRNYCFGKRLGEFEREFGARRGSRFDVFRPLKDKRFFQMVSGENQTIEGISAVREIEKNGLFVPRELEILPDIIRRIRYAVKC